VTSIMYFLGPLAWSDPQFYPVCQP